MLVVNTSVGPSAIQGVGLFAAEPIHSGTVIARWDPSFLWSCTEEQLQFFPGITRTFIEKYGWRAFGRWQLSVDNSRFLNHSADPNTSVTASADCPFVMTAIRDIALGEEITEDYRQFDPDFSTYGLEW